MRSSHSCSWRGLAASKLSAVGRERVLAGADCGFATATATPMVAPSVVWAKFKSLAEGAEIATRRLWG